MQLKTPSRPGSKKTIITTGIIVGLATGWNILSAGNAQAFAVTWNGTNYDVTTFTGTRNDNSAKFNTSANGGSMPWWGSQSDAISFIQATASSQGDLFTNLGVSPSGNVILFGYDNFMSFTAAKQYDSMLTSSGFSIADNSATVWGPGDTINWAQATEVTAVPGPLPILGIGAALGFSRKLRKRIANRKLSTTD